MEVEDNDALLFWNRSNLYIGNYQVRFLVRPPHMLTVPFVNMIKYEAVNHVTGTQAAQYILQKRTN